MKTSNRSNQKKNHRLRQEKPVKIFFISLPVEDKIWYVAENYQLENEMGLVSLLGRMAWARQSGKQKNTKHGAQGEREAEDVHSVTFNDYY